MECPRCLSKSIELVKCYKDYNLDVYKCLVCFYIFNINIPKIKKMVNLDKFIKKKVKENE